LANVSLIEASEDVIDDVQVARVAGLMVPAAGHTARKYDSTSLAPCGEPLSVAVARVADLAVAHGAVVHDLVGALVIIAFGTHPAASPQSSGRASLVQALREQLVSDIKIVHGASDGHYGLLGGETRMSYTFLVPQFDQILGTLSRLQFGESEEFTR
jgi:hypothetical protein